MASRRHVLRSLGFAALGGLALRPLSASVPLWSMADQGAVRFLVLGDWGTGGSLQKKVAAGMAVAAAKERPTAILSVGDNIYNSGVGSVDDPQWTSKYTSIYAAPELAVPWWAILGNHDYRGNVDAQVQYHQRNPRWNMPARYWHHTFPSADGVTNVHVIGLDTQQLTTQAAGWKDQLAWFERVAGTSKATWRLVLGHHPIRSYGHYGDSSLLLRELQPLLERTMTDVYFCGHEHDLQVIEHPADGLLYAVSGAGGGTRNTKQGPHSLFAASHGGFMSVSIDNRLLMLHVHDASGAVVFTHQRQLRSR
jgi:tartrate-resistant acid phosphatase type 5